MTYVSETPVGALVFRDHERRFRHSSWTVDGAFEWRTVDGYEYVVQRNGAPFTSVALTFDSDFEHRPKEYDLNIAFSDGGRLLYTGKLRVLTMACSQRPCDRPFIGSVVEPVHDWTLATNESRFIVTVDQASKSNLPVGDRDSEGTFIYFGPQVPETTSNMIMIADPATPAWMANDLRRYWPDFLQRYESGTHVALDFKPIIFLASTNLEGTGLGLGGSTLPGIVQFSVEGGDWIDGGHEARHLWLHTLAHEGFHLWNGQAFGTNLGRWEEWLSEGAADYLAARVLFASGFEKQEDFHRRIVEAANACVVQLQNRPLLASHRAGNYKPFYSCGLAILFILDRAIARAQSGADLWTALAALFERAGERDDRSYSTYSLFEEVVRLTENPLAIGGAVTLLHVGQDSIETYWRDALTEAGLEVDLVPVEHASLSQRSHTDAMARIIGTCDCGPRYSVHMSPTELEFEPHSTCNALRQGLNVTGIAGKPLAEATEAAHGALVAGIHRDGIVELDTEEGPLRLTCGPGFLLSHSALLKLRTSDQH